MRSLRRPPARRRPPAAFRAAMPRPARKTAHRAARASGRARALAPARRVAARRPTARAAPLPHKMREDRRSPTGLPLWRRSGDRGAVVRTSHSRLPSNAETTSPPERRSLPAGAREERARSCRIPPAPRSRSTRNQRVRNRPATSRASSFRCPTLPESPPASLTARRDRRPAESAPRQSSWSMRRCAGQPSLRLSFERGRACAIGQEPRAQKREQEHYRLEGRGGRESQTAGIAPDFGGEGPRSERREQ
jgi:hypothetical protein